MYKKITLLSLALVVSLMFSGCGQKSEKDGAPVEDMDDSANVSDSEQGAISSGLNVCKEEKVEIPNYGDKGKRLKNCFVQYPGEPSRQDKSYYVVEDMCGQFTKEFVENMLGKKLAKIEPSKITGLNNCSYYFNEKENVLLNLEYLPIENQKKGNEFAGYKVEKSDKIPMDNLTVWQGDILSTVYLVLNPNKFISLRPISKKTFASSEEFLNFAEKLGKVIKNYK